MVDRVLELFLTALFFLGTRTRKGNMPLKLLASGAESREDEISLLDFVNSCREIVYNCAKNMNFIKIW